MLRFRPLRRNQSRIELGLPPKVKIILLPVAMSREDEKFVLAKEAFTLFAKFSPGAMMLVGDQIDYDLVRCYINACDVVLLTSGLEVSPMIIKEALSCNVPVVSTEAGEVKHLFGNLRGCFSCEPEPREIAASLFRACGLGPIDNRRQIERIELDEDIIAEQIIGIYQSLKEEGVHENPGRPRRTQRLRLSSDRWEDRTRSPGGEVKSHQES